MKKTHGMSNTRPYRIWQGMKARCDRQSSTNYKCYGGKGISYDKRWSDFTKFWEDMETGYNNNLSIDRLNNDGDYCKSNCRWATFKQQMNNTSRNRMVTMHGQTKTLADWVRIYNTSYSVVKQRLNIQGCTPEKAFDETSFNFYFNGEIVVLKELAAKYDINYSTLKARVKKYNSVEKAVSIKPKYYLNDKPATLKYIAKTLGVNYSTLKMRVYTGQLFFGKEL